MGFFENKQGQWYYVDLSKKSFQTSQTRHWIRPGPSQPNFCLPSFSQCSTPSSGTQLVADLLPERENLLSRIQALNNSDENLSTQKKFENKKIIVSFFQGMILATRLVERHEITKNLNNEIKFFEKELCLAQNPDVINSSWRPHLDRNSLRIFGGSFLVGLSLLAFSSTFKSRPEELSLSLTERRTDAPRIIRSSSEFQKIRENEELKKSLTAHEIEDKRQTPQAPNQVNAPTPRSRGVHANARISKLIGKITANSARSRNIIITSGRAAGTAPSGRALAMVGNIERSGQDWSRETHAGGIIVSTAGLGGNRSLGASLRQGSTGTAGIGLIEDEIEMAGGLDREIIAQYIKSQLGHILYCYERQLSASPQLFGKVAVKFTIGANGQVITQRINESTLNHLEVQNCILDRVSRWKFPSPRGGTQVFVTYPFLFKSTN
jgi:TonB family protein